MRNYTYVIVGGGMTADAAAEGIRAADPAGTLGLISAEPHPPYNRPPLSKGLWKGEPEDSIWRKAAQAGGELHLGRRAVGIDLGARTVRFQETAPRHRGRAAAPAAPVGPGDLLPHPRRLPPPTRARRAAPALRGDRGRLHRERSRGRAPDAGPGGDDARARSGAGRARVSPGSLPLP